MVYKCSRPECKAFTYTSVRSWHRTHIPMLGGSSCISWLEGWQLCSDHWLTGNLMAIKSWSIFQASQNGTALVADYIFDGHWKCKQELRVKQDSHI